MGRELLLAVKSCQRYDLSCSCRRQGHECHEKIGASFQAIQELEAGQ